MTNIALALFRTLPTSALLAALVLSGWLVGRWVLYFAAPAETPAAAPRERVSLESAAQALADAHLFGMAATRAGGEALSNLNIKLRGVLAGTSGFAILNTGERDQTTRVGSEVVPGVVLEAVHAQHVVLRRNGALERVNLEERQQLAAVPASPDPSRRARSRSVAAPEPAPRSAAPRSGARFQRPEPYAPVGDAPTEPPAESPAPPPGQPTVPAPVAAPGAPPAAAAAPGTGLVVNALPPGGLLERIGLQPGDVIRSVSGEAVANEADILRIVQSRSGEGTLTLEVQRGGMTLPLTVKTQR
jgi:general secretion pathway protein C